MKMQVKSKILRVLQAALFSGKFVGIYFISSSYGSINSSHIIAENSAATCSGVPKRIILKHNCYSTIDLSYIFFH